jgi:hypothetical protein
MPHELRVRQLEGTSTGNCYARLGLGDDSSSQPVHHRKDFTYAKYRDAFLHSPVSTLCGSLGLMNWTGTPSIHRV